MQVSVSKILSRAPRIPLFLRRNKSRKNGGGATYFLKQFRFHNVQNSCVYLHVLSNQWLIDEARGCCSLNRLVSREGSRQSRLCCRWPGEELRKKIAHSHQPVLSGYFGLNARGDATIARRGKGKEKTYVTSRMWKLFPDRSFGSNLFSQFPRQCAQSRLQSRHLHLRHAYLNVEMAI